MTLVWASDFFGRRTFTGRVSYQVPVSPDVVGFFLRTLLVLSDVDLPGIVGCRTLSDIIRLSLAYHKSIMSNIVIIGLS